MSGERRIPLLLLPSCGAIKKDYRGLRLHCVDRPTTERTWSRSAEIRDAVERAIRKNERPERSVTVVGRTGERMQNALFPRGFSFGRARQLVEGSAAQITVAVSAAARAGDAV